jgi:ParB-like chromosome segregation protein Spo0J
MSALPKLNYKKLDQHPLGATFPMMSDDEYAKLKNSIKRRGFDPTEPVLIYEGKILDGMHRYTAAKAVKKEARFEEFRGTYGEAANLVTARNLARRNLTPSQAAAVGAKIVKALEDQEKAEKAAAKAAGKQPKSSLRGKGTKASIAAKQVGVSERSVAAAVALGKEAPEELEKVAQGKKKLNTANKTIAEKSRKTDAFADAKATIAKMVSEEFAHTAEKNLTAKEFIKMAGLTVIEVRRIQPLIECGWKLSLAMGYKSTRLTVAHPMRAYLEAAQSQNGHLQYECTHFKKEYEVTIKEKEVKP